MERCSAVSHRERGDTLFALDVAAALAATPHLPQKKILTPKKRPISPRARTIGNLAPARRRSRHFPGRTKLALVTNAINQRQEKLKDVELYEVALASSPAVAGSATNLRNSAA